MMSTAFVVVSLLMGWLVISVEPDIAATPGSSLPAQPLASPDAKRPGSALAASVPQTQAPQKEAGLLPPTITDEHQAAISVSAPAPANGLTPETAKVSLPDTAETNQDAPAVPIASSTPLAVQTDKIMISEPSSLIPPLKSDQSLQAAAGNLPVNAQAKDANTAAIRLPSSAGPDSATQQNSIFSVTPLKMDTTGSTKRTTVSIMQHQRTGVEKTVAAPSDRAAPADRADPALSAGKQKRPHRATSPVLSATASSATNTADSNVSGPSLSAHSNTPPAGQTEKISAWKAASLAAEKSASQPAPAPAESVSPAIPTAGEMSASVSTGGTPSRPEQAVLSAPPLLENIPAAGTLWLARAGSYASAEAAFAERQRLQDAGFSADVIVLYASEHKPWFSLLAGVKSKKSDALAVCTAFRTRMKAPCTPIPFAGSKYSERARLARKAL